MIYFMVPSAFNNIRLVATPAHPARWRDSASLLSPSHCFLIKTMLGLDATQTDVVKRAYKK
jgi:hypothetical protein